VTTLRLIADDLTGALDSAAQFTGRMGPLPVLLDRTIAAPEGTYVLDLSCRDGGEEQAVAATRETIGCFSGADLAFKKIDSLMRGHWAAELAEIVRSGAFRQIVLAPAFPAQGRITRNGRQMRTQASGEAVLIMDLAAELARYGLGLGSGKCAIVLADASNDADLDAIAELYSDRPATLWCGAAGLARALARRPPAPARPLGLPHLAIVGSHHPVALRQVEALAADRPAWLARFNDDPASIVRRIGATFETSGRCVALPDLGPGLEQKEAASRIADSLRALSGLPPPAALTVVGGETFAALCRALEARRLVVDGEFEPGVPGSHMASGLWQGTICASKSGAFGEPEWLMKHLGEANWMRF
jgi:D-threonate/D-erythronate kinase